MVNAQISYFTWNDAQLAIETRLMVSLELSCTTDNLITRYQTTTYLIQTVLSVSISPEIEEETNREFCNLICPQSASSTIQSICPQIKQMDGSVEAGAYHNDKDQAKNNRTLIMMKLISLIQPQTLCDFLPDSVLEHNVDADTNHVTDNAVYV